MKILNTRNIHLKKVHIALTGISGDGKTYSIRTLKGKPFVISTDKGELSLKGTEISYVAPRSWLEFVKWMKFVTSPQFIEKKYTHVVIDSVTQAAEYLKEYLEEKEIEGFDFWKQYKKHVGGILKTMRDSDTFDSVCIFEYIDKEDKNGVVSKRMSVEGSLCSQIPYFFDFVFAAKCIESTDKKPKQYCFQTCKKGGWNFCKVRGDIVLNDYEPANLDKLIRKIRSTT